MSTVVLSAIATYLIFFLPAILALARFVFSLVRFIKADQLSEARKERKVYLITASITLGVVAAVYAALFVLLTVGLRNM